MMRILVQLAVLALVTFAAAEEKKTRCVVCDSVADEACDDHFIPDDKKVLTCEDKRKINGEDVDFKGCRKYVQEVNDKNRISRDCAYNEDGDGLKRTGNKGVRVWDYVCEEGGACNGAVHAAAATLPLLLAVVLLVGRE